MGEELFVKRLNVNETAFTPARPYLTWSACCKGDTGQISLAVHLTGEDRLRMLFLSSPSCQLIQNSHLSDAVVSKLQVHGSTWKRPGEHRNAHSWKRWRGGEEGKARRKDKISVQGRPISKCAFQAHSRWWDSNSMLKEAACTDVQRLAAGPDVGCLPGLNRTYTRAACIVTWFIITQYPRHIHII